MQTMITYSVYNGLKKIHSFKTSNDKQAQLRCLMLLSRLESPAECIWNKEQKCWYIHINQAPYKRKVVLRLEKEKRK